MNIIRREIQDIKENQMGSGDKISEIKFSHFPINSG